MSFPTPFLRLLLKYFHFQNPRPFRDRKILPLRLCSVAQPLQGPQTQASDSSLSLSPHLEETHGSWVLAAKLSADSTARCVFTPALAPFINTPRLISSPQLPSSRYSDSTLIQVEPDHPPKAFFQKLFPHCTCVWGSRNGKFPHSPSGASTVCLPDRGTGHRESKSSIRAPYP